VNLLIHTAISGRAPGTLKGLILRHRASTLFNIAGVAELADAQDSGSCEVHPSCGFESHLRQRSPHPLDAMRNPSGYVRDAHTASKTKIICRSRNLEVTLDSVHAGAGIRCPASRPRASSK
jgi:hypothetical protein